MEFKLERFLPGGEQEDPDANNWSGEEDMSQDESFAAPSGIFYRESGAQVPVGGYRRSRHDREERAHYLHGNSAICSDSASVLKNIHEYHIYDM